jgi:hypothetical protein
MGILKKLKKNRTPILLAEIGAYLHDLGKARKEFIEYYSKDGGSNWDKNKHNFPSIFPSTLKDILTRIKVRACREEASLIDFIEKHHDKTEIGLERKDCEIPPLIRLLYAGWRGYDGMDSGLDKGNVDNEGKQRKNYTFIATAFGYEFNKIEIDKLKDLTGELYGHILDALKQFKSNDDIVQLREAIMCTRVYYKEFLGETRRSANDVTLWDHSYSVATLVKCVMAKNIIDYPNTSFDPLDFNWKVFSVNFDILKLLAKGVKVGDILGYWERINSALKKVKKLIEIEYPIGNEIYRDTSGIFFLVPEIDLEELKKLILNEIENIEPELMPQIVIKETTHVKSSDYKFICNDSKDSIPRDIKQARKKVEEYKKEALKTVLPETRKEAFKEIFYPTSSTRFFSDKFVDNWSGKEICSICRLRPMDENSNGCNHCLERRKSRAEEWIREPKYTIWLDEVSDYNDRVALLIGCFILDNWLNGSLIKTMAIRANRANPPMPKNPSLARIRRCWETTQEFINTIFDETLEKYDWKLDIRRKRVQFKIEPNPDIPKGSTCDIDVEGVRFSPVCINNTDGIFVSTINLEILKEWGNTIEDIASFIDRKSIKIKCEKDRNWRNAKIVQSKPAEKEFQDYLPYVKIYDFPDQFMVLVPAYEALDIAEKILNEYEIQFSKVRDRLPFHLGIIAFHRKTPLYVVMDAGKRLIETFRKRTESIDAKVISVREVEDEKFGKSKELTIKAGSYSSIPFKWRVSYSTADPSQEDRWHPYIRFNGDPNRDLSFDYTGNGDYVLHVKEIGENDQVKIETSYFRLFYLENAADRFKVDEDLRPLSEIYRLKKLWEQIEKRLTLRTLSISRLHAFWEEITKRRDYRDDNFEKFVKSVLINVLEISPQKDEKLFDTFLQAAKDGLLELCLNWNLQVRKIKPIREGAK